MPPRRSSTVVLALAAIALALPTIAAPMDGTTADPVTDGVTITTANSTNAEYVSTTQDGELTLDLSASNPALRGNGVNPGARTSISDAFRLRYDGDTAATVWLTSDAEGITFSVGGVGADSATNTVTLTPDESVPVGFVVDTTGEAPPPTATFTVHARTADDGGAPERAAGAASADPAEPVTTRVTSPDAATRTLTLRNTAAGRSLTLDLNRLVVARAGDGVVTLDELSVVSDGGAVDLDVAVTAPNATGALPTDASVRPLGAVRIEERRGAVERATLRFAVDRAYLDATGLSAEELTVYRYDGAEWSERGVEVVATREDRIVLEAETPGFSTFVVAAKVPDLRITAADLRRGPSHRTSARR
ncbi:PGF-pre-PGF domain-containing protein [Haloplanus litoreus]|uniref:PGF-pre-PGF domain-containing protein n=1 Tax=Haloplanus litoreus TaxID=767515 RepID=UPI003610038C